MTRPRSLVLACAVALLLLGGCGAVPRGQPAPFPGPHATADAAPGGPALLEATGGGARLLQLDWEPAAADAPAALAGRYRMPWPTSLAGRRIVVEGRDGDGGLLFTRETLARPEPHTARHKRPRPAGFRLELPAAEGLAALIVRVPVAPGG